MRNKNSVLSKDDANKALDNINMWINNCDTKTSIILGFYATIITICFTTDFLDYHKVIQSPTHTCLFTLTLVILPSTLQKFMGETPSLHAT